MAAGIGKEVSIQTLFKVFRKRLWYIVFAALLLTAAAAIYAIGQPDRFRSQALLATEPTAVSNYVKGNAITGQVHIQEKLWLIRESVLNTEVLETLIQEFHLYEVKPPTTFIEKMSAHARLLLKNAKKTLALDSPEMTEQERRLRQIEDLKDRILIQVEAADAFAIGFEGSSRQQAMDVSNQLAVMLIQRTSAAGEQNATWAASFLKEQVEQAKQKMDEQNDRIRQYQQQASDAQPARMVADLKLLESLQTQLQAKTERIANEQARRLAVLQEMKDLESRGALESSTKSATELKLEEQRLRLEQLQGRYTEQYPEIKNLKAEIKDLERAVAAESGNRVSRGEPSPAQLRYLALKSEAEEIDQRLQSYRQQEKQLTAQLETFELKVGSAPLRERNLGELVRDYEVSRAEYQSLLEKQNQAQLDERLSKVNQGSVFRIIRPAQLPLEPSSPQRLRIILLGLFAGLGLGIGMAFLSEYRDTSYDNAEDFRSSTNLPVLTVVPAMESVSSGAKYRSGVVGLGLEKNSNGSRDRVVTLSAPRSIAAEQYGVLALEVRQLLGRDSSKVLAVTSAVGGEGKTTTSLNLSIALSKTLEHRVLLVEGDLRRPRLQEYLGFAPRKGFSNLLQAPDSPIEPYLLRLNGLSIILGGAALKDPLQLLESPQTQSLFARFRQMFEIIVVDTPPLLPIADTHVLAGLADGVIVVVRARQTPREVLQEALQGYRSPNLLGAVLNGVDLKRSRYSYAYEYYATNYLTPEKSGKVARP